MIRRFNELKEFDSKQPLKLRYFAFDWDDNILHMPTVIHMEQKVGDNWLKVDVSTAKFAEIRHDKENYRILENNPELAFCEFRDTGPRGNKAFFEDTLKALNEGKKAPAWDAFLKCLSEGAIFSIITARGHEPESLKKGVEYIIDNILVNTPSMNPGRSLADEMYQNLKKYMFYFDTLTGQEEKELTGKPSSSKLVQDYLSHCDFFGVSSDSFAQKFGQGTAANPEEAKKKALDYCIEKCLRYSKIIEEKSKQPVKVTFGMSDDDPKNSSHLKDFFSEKAELSKDLSLHFYQTTDVSIPGGEKTSYGVTETSHQTPGLESSVLPFTKWNNMTQRLYPSSKDAPLDDYHNKMKNQTGMTNDLYKKFGFKRKKNKSKK